MTFTLLKKAVLSTVLFLSASPVFAAPVNDNCASALLLTQTQTCSYTSGTTVGATASPFSSTCNGNAEGDVWYKFIATGTAAVITVQGSENFDAVVQLVSSCVGTSLYCTDQNGSGGTEKISATGLISGQTYFIRVYDYYARVAASSTFNICVSTIAIPGNDDCSNAYVLSPSPLCSVTNGTTYGATASGSSSTCLSGNPDEDVWFQFVAPSTNVTINVQGGAGFDAVVQVYNSCGGTNIYCKDNTINGGLETIVTSGLIAGQSYFIRVYDYETGASVASTFTICLTAPLPPAPVNDNCANAISLGSASCFPVTGTTAGATASAFASSCDGSANDDVWYKFVASGPDAYVRVAGISDIDVVVEVLDGCTGTAIKCSDVTANNGMESFFLSLLTHGNTYFIRVYEYDSKDYYDNSFSICVSYQGPLLNDDCATAVTLPVTNAKSNLVSGTTSGASYSSSSSCLGTPDDDVWYKFVASSPKDSIYVVSAGSFDAVVGVYDACGGASMYCVDNTNSGGAENVYTTGLVTGSIYYIQVYHYSADISSTPSFQVSVYNGSIVTGLSNASALQSLTLYPNPASSEITLDLNAHKNEATIEFYDGQGRLVKTEKATAASRVVVSLAELLDGIYTVRIISEGLISTGKMVVVK